MPSASPPLDKRTQDDIVGETERLAEAYSGWKKKPAGSYDLGSALIRIFGRMAAQAVDRLNRVPDRSLLAFLSLVGVEPGAPRPARVPLTFTLAAGGTACPVVPAGTRIGATAAPDDPAEVIFETTLGLVTTRSKIEAARVHEPANDRWADTTARAKGESEGLYAAFAGDTAIEHSLFIAADEVLALPKNTVVTLSIALTAADVPKWVDLCTKPVGAPLLEWSHSDGNTWVPLANLTVLTPAAGATTAQLTFKAPGPVAAASVDGKSARWLHARLRSFPAAVPSISTITLSAPVTITGRLPELAYQNGLPVEMGADFFPLGERPRFNDAFYLASSEIFSRPLATVTLNITPGETRAALTASDAPTLVWEARTGASWKEVGRSTKTEATGSGFTDETLALSKVVTAQSPGPFKVVFTAPADIAPGTVQGTTSSWVRARLLKGGYGSGVVVESGVVRDDGIRPPILKNVTLNVSYTLTVQATTVLTRNHFAFTDRSAAVISPFVPFTRSAEARPSFYLGFDQPFENRTMTLYVQVAPLSPDALQGGLSASPAEVLWEYSSPSGWAPLGAMDETRGFSRSGLVQFLGPLDFVAMDAFGESRRWLRARWAGGDFAASPRLGHISTNTVWATHTTTIRDEVLSSRQEGESRVFTTTSAPVLAGEILLVRETEAPSPIERAALGPPGDASIVTIARGDDGHIDEVWVRWRSVPDFHASGPRDRHYTIDRATGEIRFGDGTQGMAPPLGAGSVRAAFYQTGGGAYGNRATGAITSLKTAVPYIDGVTNSEPATGGADADGTERLVERGSRLLRHGFRAVAAEDFEDLALEASTAVARAKAVSPHFDPIYQSTNPGTVADAGKVGLIVVPAGSERRPTPTLGLIQDVETYIKARSSPSVSLRISGPDWVQVTATMKIVPAAAEGSDLIRTATLATLDRFLHPLTGGFEGKGWDFGRLPRVSDLYPLLSAIPGVGYIRSLSLIYTRPGDLPIEGVTAPVGPVFDEATAGDAIDRVLVFSGQHEVQLLTPEL